MNVQIGTKNGILISAAFIDPLFLYTGTEYKIEEFPLEWYDGLYYETYKDQVFKVDILTEKKTAAEYDNTLVIEMVNKQLNTIISYTFLSKFKNLQRLIVNNNTNLIVTDISNNKNLISIIAHNTNSIITDISNNINLVVFTVSYTNSAITDISNNINLTTVYLTNTNSIITDISNNINLVVLSLVNTESKITTVSNNVKINNLSLQETNTTAEDINQILQDLINNNTPTSLEGVFTYSNLAGINGSLENTLSNAPYNWTLIKV